MSLTPAQIMDRLEAIEADLEKRETPFETAAETYHRLVRDAEHKRALLYPQTKGSPNERKEQATALLWSTETETMQDLSAAEATYHALKAVVGVLETRATIGQSLLKAHTRAT